MSNEIASTLKYNYQSLEICATNCWKTNFCLFIYLEAENDFIALFRKRGHEISKS